MAYYKKVLQADETVKYLGGLHWIIYGYAILFGLCALAAAVWFIGATDDQRPVAEAVVAIALLLALIFYVRSWFRRAGTEIVVTDKRIILKRGLIARHTEEMNITKVETVDVEQSISGRLFGYGSVLIKGVGSSLEPLNMIAAPIALRNAIMVG
jgi:uncharacterized membrane protein YdbT with pleckstrin-like domain